jgi:hypothetical protein
VVHVACICREVGVIVEQDLDLCLVSLGVISRSSSFSVLRVFLDFVIRELSVIEAVGVIVVTQAKVLDASLMVMDLMTLSLLSRIVKL